MLKRWVIFGFVFALAALPLARMIVTSEEQGPWLVVGGVYFVLGALIGNWYVPFGMRFDLPTFFKWLAINVFAFGMIAIAYLEIVGVIDIGSLLGQ
jgi:hypothetical protein